ncbi:hypothetical protein NQ315_014841 [Exocentrus adspersus]|uniref:Peptidase aspartic putative domain-containing protein n=1 Tax=Exocentrus adspersus TaxID=1586481 RepID=A0AAV8VL48_9CUCU|nr:hypothetical protein NQ315_014841 [Exocentrus adspersus]
MSEQTLIRKRASVKARLTGFEKFFKDFIVQIRDTESETPVSDTKLAEFELRFLRAEQLVSEFDSIQNEIESITEQPDENYIIRDEFEAKYHSIIAEARTEFKKLQKAQTPVLPPATNEGNENIHCHSNKNKDPELPIIELPKFNGKGEQWLEFKDNFLDMIHSKPHLTKTAKFQYLKAAVEGSAAHVIRNIKITADNYQNAWDLLCERFDDERSLVQDHVKALFKIEPITRESSEKLRELWDDVSKNLRNLQDLGEPVESWSTLLVHIITAKFDRNSAREWEKQKSSLANRPTMEDVRAFIKKRAAYLTGLEPNQVEKHGIKRESTKSLYSGNISCPVCQKEHRIYNCTEFLSLTVIDRFKKVRELKLCVNCLRKNHMTKDCRVGGCRKCNGRHNSLVHDDRSKDDNTRTGPGETAVASSSATSSASTESAVTQQTASLAAHSLTKTVLLSTVAVFIIDKNGDKHLIRALLDSGSQSNFVSETLSQNLNLQRIENNLSVCGLNNATSNIDKKCDLTIMSCCNDFKINITCLVIREITGVLPEVEINTADFKIPPNIKLADPTFDTPRKIDLLIGSEVFWRLICVGQICSGPNDPIFQKTRFGWIVAGPINNLMSKNNKTYCNFTKTKNTEIQEQLCKFWEVEEVDIRKPYSQEELLCEKHFSDNVTRDNDGRFVVAIPFKDNVERLGNSRDLAVKRFYQLEKRLLANGSFRELYVLVRPEERKYQKIIWRENQDSPLKTYRLNTVTYGSASFLAIRCLKELADEFRSANPDISRIIEEDMYVDDLLSGAETPEQARLICETISRILATGGFELRKWRSNAPHVIDDIIKSDSTSNILEFSLDKEQSCKTLE